MGQLVQAWTKELVGLFCTQLDATGKDWKSSYNRGDCHG